MKLDRRQMLGVGAALAGVAAAPASASAGMRRIACEEGFSVPELIDAVDRYMAGGAADEPGMRALIGTGKFPRWPRLLDPEIRLKDMARSNVDMQIIMLNSPGVQIFEPGEANALATLVNDRAAEWTRRWPGKFAALAAIAPQDPAAAALELERAVRRLGAKGAVINSHTKGAYLDEPRFWPIFEAAQALDVPVYIHPREPAPGALPAYAERRLEGAIWGYAAETALHSLRLITGGVFEAFPRLKIVVGHDGEGIPFYLDRIDNRYRTLNGGGLGPLKRSPATIFRENFWVTTSGANWSPAVRFCQQVLGADRVLFAVDYPFEDEDAAVAQAAAIAMPTEEAELFFHRNAERLFRLV
ncbi:2,3-dihydroxybenzoate decarboxylase [Sphingomonas zeicaulis]|uniref:amidohydrolase family protein n=1 Tax=Sphingomonas zeicaulis TaxID=1632740 RepID=UPI003D192123